MLFEVVAPNGDYFLLQSCKFVLPSDHCSKTVSLVITFHLFSLSTPVFAIYLGQLLLDLFLSSREKTRLFELVIRSLTFGRAFTMGTDLLAF